MIEKDLESNIAIILSQVEYQEVMWFSTHPTPTGGIRIGPKRLTSPPGLMAKSNEKLRVLRLLYSQCPSELKDRFVPLLFTHLSPDNATFLLIAALEVGTVVDVASHLTGDEHRTLLPLWQGLEQKLLYESESFNEKELQLIADMRQASETSVTPADAEDLESLLERVDEEIAEVRYLRLKKELEAHVNPEINTDRENLISRMSKLGFRKEITTALENVEKKLLTAATALDFKGVMDLIRTIYEEMFEDTAKELARRKGKGPLQYNKPFQPWNQFLRNEEILDDAEMELSQKLYNYLSSVGTHALGSAPEQARVSKNMVIELALMIVGRVQNVQ